MFTKLNKSDYYLRKDKRITNEQKNTQSAVVLDAGEIKDLPPEDIRMILRGADELIFTGGRNMLAKLLKGSKDKKILEYKLNECPAYGYYHNLKLNDISKCVDWMIEKDYLRIKYDYRLPLLVFSEQGWEIEKETFAEELYQRFCLDVKENMLVSSSN